MPWGIFIILPTFIVLISLILLTVVIVANALAYFTGAEMNFAIIAAAIVAIGSFFFMGKMIHTFKQIQFLADLENDYEDDFQKEEDSYQKPYKTKKRKIKTIK